VITADTIDRLRKVEANGARVLSVYLDLSPDRQLERAFVIAFKDVVRDAQDGLDEEARKELRRERDRVLLWLEDVKPAGAGLAVFSSEPRDLWEAEFLPRTVRDEAHFEPAPHLVPLVDLVDELERYCVAVVDKEKARLYSVFMGEVEQSDRFKDFIPQKSDQGGPAQPRLQRHHETHVLWHLKKVVEHLSELLEQKAFDRLIVVGPEEATSELRGLLTHELSERLAAVVPGEVNAGEARILEIARQVEEHLERDEEQRLVDEVLEVAGGGGLAACGLQPTIDALILGSVHQLVIADGARATGSVCPGCGWLTSELASDDSSPVGRREPGASRAAGAEGRSRTGSIETCPISGDAMDVTDDLVDRLVQRTLAEKGTVEVVHGEAASRLSERCGGVAAVLRFR
jgi:peptide chain release factor subunit 1